MTERGDVMGHTGPGVAGPQPKPEWLHRRLEWFMDQRFGIFFHWGPYCQWDCCESWPLVPDDPWARPDGMRCWEERGRDLGRFQRDYWDLPRTFNPTDFDPDAWAEAAAAAGMRYVTFTTKHHDGFCMFDTATTDYRITHPSYPFHAHPRANIAREVFEAFRRRNLAISCYFSKSDWRSPHYWSPSWPAQTRNPNYDTRENPEIWERFVQFVHAQVRELMTNYGPVDLLWLDGGQVNAANGQDIRMADMAAMARALQPGLIVADRTVGGDFEDFITPEHQIPDTPLDTPWESCLTLGTSWKFVEGEVFRPAHEVIRMLAETASKGGNLLLGFGPDPQGRLPAGAVQRLREVGRWMDAAGEAIHGTRPIPPYGGDGVRYTARGATTWAIVLDPPATLRTGRLVQLPGLCPARGAAVTACGLPGALAWRATGEGCEVTLPSEISGPMPVALRFDRGQTVGAAG